MHHCWAENTVSTCLDRWMIDGINSKFSKQPYQCKINGEWLWIIKYQETNNIFKEYKNKKQNHTDNNNNNNNNNTNRVNEWINKYMNEWMARQ